MSKTTSIEDLNSRTDPALRQRRQWWDRTFVWLCLATSFLSIAILLVLMGSILVSGVPQLSGRLITSGYSTDSQQAGYWPALWGTIWTCGICAFFSLPIGVGTAILLEEFVPRHQLMRFFHGLVRLNIANLAGVPSVVYGILSLTAFVSMFGLFNHSTWEIGVSYFDQFITENDMVVLLPVSGKEAPLSKATAESAFLNYEFQLVDVVVIPETGAPPDNIAPDVPVIREGSEPGRIDIHKWYFLKLPFGAGVLTGGLTLMLVVLPIVIISSQEALRSVPFALREGAFGLGATPWQVVWNVTLPSAVPGIMTGAILSMSRAIGEAAPILIIAGIIFITNSPDSLMSDFTVMPLQIYTWTSYPQADFHLLAASGIIILLVMLLSFNALAVFIRYRAQRTLQ